MKYLRKLSAIFDCIVNIAALLAAAVLVFIVLSVCLGVVMRYFLGQALIWVPEVNMYTLVPVTFLSATWLLKGEGHVKMDIVVDCFNPRNQTIIDVATSIICAIMFLVITWYGALTTWDHFLRGVYDYGSVLRIPRAYVLFFVLVSSFLLFIQFLRRALGYLYGAGEIGRTGNEGPGKSNKTKL
jgi:TRAP-type C4-dicarboxylate transport system permease small subunit